MATSGYVPLRRGIVEHLHGMTGNEAKVYLALLCLANFNTGTLSITMRDIADLTGISASSVQRAMSLLAEPHNDSGTRYISYTPARNQFISTRVRILKYAVPPVKQRRNSGGTAEEQHTHPDLRKGGSKNLENLENSKNVVQGTEDEDFEAWWNLYGKKVGRKVSLEKWRVCLKEHTPEEIVAGTRKYLAYCKATDRLLKDPATFLNQRSFLDEWDAPAPQRESVVLREF